MSRLLIKKITSLNAEQTEKLIKSLSASARAHLESKTETHARASSLCAYSLLSEEERAGLCFDTKGKPYFAQLDACISISHSAHFAAVLISDSQSIAVGVDIEEPSLTEERQHRLAERFFTENEKRAYQNGMPFYEIWTRKEALFKCLDEKNDSLLSVDICTSPRLSFKTTTTDEYILSICERSNKLV